VEERQHIKRHSIKDGERCYRAPIASEAEVNLRAQQKSATREIPLQRELEQKKTKRLKKL